MFIAFSIGYALDTGRACKPFSSNVCARSALELVLAITHGTFQLVLALLPLVRLPVVQAGLTEVVPAVRDVKLLVSDEVVADGALPLLLELLCPRPAARAVRRTLTVVVLVACAAGSGTGAPRASQASFSPKKKKKEKTRSNDAEDITPKVPLIWRLLSTLRDIGPPSTHEADCSPLSTHEEAVSWSDEVADSRLMDAYSAVKSAQA